MQGAMPGADDTPVFDVEAHRNHVFGVGALHEIDAAQVDEHTLAVHRAAWSGLVGGQGAQHQRAEAGASEPGVGLGRAALEVKPFVGVVRIVLADAFAPGVETQVQDGIGRVDVRRAGRTGGWHGRSCRLGAPGAVRRAWCSRLYCRDAGVDNPLARGAGQRW